MATKEEIIQAANIGRIKEKATPQNQKKKSAIEMGLKGDKIDYAIKMKRGCGNSIQLSLDGDPESTAFLSFRVLSALEEAKIEQEMLASDFPERSDSYNLLFILKRLAVATSAPPSNIANTQQEQPSFSADELGSFLSKGQIFSLGLLYNDFLIKHNPNINNFTQEEVNDLVNDISAAVGDPDPKLRMVALQLIYQECNTNLIYAALIESVSRWNELISQVDK